MAQQTDEILAGITQFILNEVPNGLERATPLLKYVTTKGKKKRDGAASLQFPVKLLENQASGFLTGEGDQVDLTPSIQMQYGTLNWKCYNFNVPFTLMEYAKAGGAEDKIGWVEEKVKGALEDSYNELSAAFHGTNSGDSKKFNGLKDIVAASGTSYAGLLNTDYATGAYLPIITTDTILNYQNVTKMINKVRARKRSGNQDNVFGLMNESMYTKYQTIIQNQQIAVNTSALFASGFEGFKINGVEFYLDADCPGTQDGTTADNYLYIIPMDVLQFHYIYGLGTASPMDGKTAIPNQTIDAARHFMVGNLVCNNRRLIAVNKTFIA